MEILLDVIGHGSVWGENAEPIPVNSALRLWCQEAIPKYPEEALPHLLIDERLSLPEGLVMKNSRSLKKILGRGLRCKVGGEAFGLSCKLESLLLAIRGLAQCTSIRVEGETVARYVNGDLHVVLRPRWSQKSSYAFLAASFASAIEGNVGRSCEG